MRRYPHWHPPSQGWPWSALHAAAGTCRNRGVGVSSLGLGVTCCWLCHPVTLYASDRGFSVFGQASLVILLYLSVLPTAVLVSSLIFSSACLGLDLDGEWPEDCKEYLRNLRRIFFALFFFFNQRKTILIFLFPGCLTVISRVFKLCKSPGASMFYPACVS